jgi:hypothetical protein
MEPHTSTDPEPADNRDQSAVEVDRILDTLYGNGEESGAADRNLLQPRQPSRPAQRRPTT